MQTLFRALAELIIKRPAVVIAAVLVVTVVLGVFATQSVTVQEVVTEDNELTRALDVIEENFGEPTSVLQVVLEAQGDIRSAASLAALSSIEKAILESDAAATLVSGGQQPPVVSFLTGVARAAEAAGMNPAQLSDEMVAAFQQKAIEMAPPQFAALYESLMGSGEPPSSGLMLVFQDTTGLGPLEVIEQQRELFDVIKTVEAPEGVSVTPFSFGLLLTASDPGPEIGRLFGIAMGIVLLILAVVYWLRPGPGQRRLILGRTAADVGLTLVIIMIAVVWMQGAGVLLGPDYLGLTDYFSPQTQVVPILIVGLGVDFAIHILARYRFETGTLGDPEKALRIAMTTTGFTLLLATGATAIGFLTNLSSPVSFLATLGVLAAVGISAAFVLAVTFLPAVRIILDRRAARKGRLPLKALAGQATSSLSRIAAKAAWPAERAPVATVIIAVLLTVLGGYGFTQLESEFNLTDFVPKNEPLLATFDTLSKEFGGGFEERTQVLVTGDIAGPGAHNALIGAVAASAEVPGVQSVGGFADANSIASVLGQAFGAGYAAELGVLGVRPDLTVGSDVDVAAVYDYLIASVPAAGQVLARDDGGSLITRVDIRTSGGQNGVAALTAGLKEVFSPVEEAGAEFVITSQTISQARQSQAIENSQVLSLLIALGGAMLLLTVHYTIYARKPLIGIITVLPVGLVLALTFGAMAVTGIPINPVTATLAALSIGIGVPFTIHLTSRFLEERKKTPDCKLALRRTVSQTGSALAGSALTTAIGFGVLITSTLIPFQQLGYVIVYAIVFSLFAAVLVLPSMLVLWDNRDRRRHGSPAPAGEPGDSRGCME
ncbi:MAG: MMPL family transporter [Dehalococcoidaceae bacterium]|nr:MMPL family transporter [Dehalococcoidaceae bacterium]